MAASPLTRRPRSFRLAIGILTSVLMLAAAVGGITVALGSAHQPRAISPHGAIPDRPVPATGPSTVLRSFAWLASTTPPASSTRLTLSSGLGSLSIPVGFRAVSGDPSTATFAHFGSGGTFLGYLNVTPLQGDEHLQGFAAFRLAHLRDDGTTAVTQDAAIDAVRNGDALRSCVTDDYVTEVGHHHFQEVACLVMAGAAGSVVVAATPSGDPGHLWTPLERAVATYLP